MLHVLRRAPLRVTAIVIAAARGHPQIVNREPIVDLSARRGERKGLVRMRAPRASRPRIRHLPTPVLGLRAEMGAPKVAVGVDVVVVEAAVEVVARKAGAVVDHKVATHLSSRLGRVKSVSRLVGNLLDPQILSLA